MYLFPLHGFHVQDPNIVKCLIAFIETTYQQKLWTFIKSKTTGCMLHSPNRPCLSTLGNKLLTLLIGKTMAYTLSPYVNGSLNILQYYILITAITFFLCSLTSSKTALQYANVSKLIQSNNLPFSESQLHTHH